MDKVKNALEQAKSEKDLSSCITYISEAFNLLKKYLENEYDQNASTNDESITYKCYQKFVKQGFNEESIDGKMIITNEDVDNLANFIKGNKQSKFRAFFKQSRISKIEKPLQDVMENLEKFKQSLYEVISKGVLQSDKRLEYPIQVIEHFYKLDENQKERLKHFLLLNAFFDNKDLKNSFYNLKN